MRNVKPLINEFEVVQNSEVESKIEQICNNFLKKDTRNFRISILLFIASLLGCIFVGPIFLSLAGVGTGIAIHGLLRTDDLNRDLDAIKKSNFAPTTPIVTNEIREVLTNYRKKYHTEFCSNNSTTEVVKASLEDNAFLNKSNTMQVIGNELAIYQNHYNIKNFIVTDVEWQMLFDLTYDLFKSKGIEKSYYDFMSQLLRYALTNHLLHNDTTVSIHNFLESFKYINIEYISEKELEDIGNVILKETSKSKIVSISKLLTKEIK